MTVRNFIEGMAKFNILCDKMQFRKEWSMHVKHLITIDA